MRDLSEKEKKQYTYKFQKRTNRFIKSEAKLSDQNRVQYVSPQGFIDYIVANKLQTPVGQLIKIEPQAKDGENPVIEIDFNKLRKEGIFGRYDEFNDKIVKYKKTFAFFNNIDFNHCSLRLKNATDRDIARFRKCYRIQNLIFDNCKFKHNDFKSVYCDGAIHIKDSDVSQSKIGSWTGYVRAKALIISGKSEFNKNIVEQMITAHTVISPESKCVDNTVINSYLGELRSDIRKGELSGDEKDKADVKDACKMAEFVGNNKLVNSYISNVDDLNKVMESIKNKVKNEGIKTNDNNNKNTFVMNNKMGGVKVNGITIPPDTMKDILTFQDNVKSQDIQTGKEYVIANDKGSVVKQRINDLQKEMSIPNPSSVESIANEPKEEIPENCKDFFVQPNTSKEYYTWNDNRENQVFTFNTGADLYDISNQLEDDKGENVIEPDLDKVKDHLDKELDVASPDGDYKKTKVQRHATMGDKDKNFDKIRLNMSIEGCADMILDIVNNINLLANKSIKVGYNLTSYKNKWMKPNHNKQVEKEKDLELEDKIKKAHQEEKETKQEYSDVNKEEASKEYKQGDKVR